MGDYERTFGVGTDAASIRVREERSGKPDEREMELRAWMASMEARGYTKGPQFSSYESLSAWDSSNTRSHIRRPSYRGYFVYFTDSRSNFSPREIVTTTTSRFDGYLGNTPAATALLLWY